MTGSILDMLWSDLDSTMDILMDPDGFELEYDILEYRGRAQGVAYAISLMQNPYLKDVAAVRELAVERYEQRTEGKPVTPLKVRPPV